MSLKHQFGIKLGHIQKALTAHAEEVAPPDMPLGIVYLRYGVILQAVFDLHHGSQEEQASALQYFQSDLYPAHLEQTYCPKKIMDMIVYEPSSYNTSAYDQEDENDDLFI